MTGTFFKTLLILLVTLYNRICSGQPAMPAREILLRIAVAQSPGDNFYSPGIFPSFSSRTIKYSEKRKDNNIYYTALILFILKELRPLLTIPDRVLVDSISSKAKRAFPFFANKNDRPCYNFWRTDTAYPIPFSKWLARRGEKLGDDPDCTSMCLMTSDASTEKVEQALDLMNTFCNIPSSPSKRIPKKYRVFRAYSSWIWDGQPAILDLCPVANILTMVQLYDLPWTKVDSASLEFIIASIRNDDYLNIPETLSPYFGKTSLILYHLARLMTAKPLPLLEELKPQLIKEAIHELNQSKNAFEKLILGTALLKWGITLGFDQLDQIAIRKSDFSFFMANPSSFLNFSNGLRLIAKHKWNYHYYCPAFNDALMLENILLREIIH
jgi:hypothetical protein